MTLLISECCLRGCWCKSLSYDTRTHSPRAASLCSSSSLSVLCGRPICRTWFCPSLLDLHSSTLFVPGITKDKMCLYKEEEKKKHKGLSRSTSRATNTAHQHLLHILSLIILMTSFIHSLWGPCSAEYEL